MLKKLLLLALILAALFNPWTLAWMARQLVVADDLRPVDAVAPLRGSPEEEQARLDEAVRLVQEKYASILLVSTDARPFYGQPNRERVEDYLRERQFPLSQLRFCENRADHTAEEARALRACLQQMDAQRAIIVTSEYHTRRTRFLFRRAFAGTGIEARVHPVYNPKYWNPHWWRRRRWAKTFLTESVSLLWNSVEQWGSPLRAVPSRVEIFSPAQAEVDNPPSP